jgi:hypothetical protein
MTQVAQTDSELRVFSIFVACCGEPIDPCSVTKENPPSPDISCKYTNGDVVSFELVEFLEQGFARTYGFQSRVVSALNEHFRKMDARDRATFLTLYGDADIQVNFQDDCSSGRALQAIPQIFRELLLKPAGFEDLIDTFSDPGLLRAVLSISVQRANIRGPIFDSPSGGFLDDPCVDAIAQKLRKSYTTTAPIELIAYIDRNPMFPEDVWKPQLTSFLGGLPSIAPFRRIWVLDLNTQKIEMKWPVRQ